MSAFLKAQTLAIYSQNCSKLLSPLSQCEICMQICPVKTLVFDEDQWHADQCVQCGLCAALCPNQVFHLDTPALKKLALTQQTLQFTCMRNKQAPAEALRLNCLQQFSPLHIFALLSSGADLTIYYCPEDCAHCEMHWYPASLEIQLKQYHLSLEHLHLEVLNAAEPDQATDRRSFLKEISSTTKQTSKHIILNSLDRFLAPFEDPVKANRAASDVPPSRKPLLTLFQKNTPHINLEQELPFRRLQCDACNFCGACTHLCPTKALQMTHAEQEHFLTYHPALCNQCNLCLDICFKHQLTWQEHMTIAEFLSPAPQILAHSQEKVCEHCGQFYYQYPNNGHALCSFCLQ